ncbi:DDE-type integrase/transposase/recombinase [Pseudomonas fragi]|nr:DDE-type integrase/transposase/recombinase [Pseudomonas fragi]
MPPNSGLVLSGNLDADLVSIALDMADEQLRKPQGLRFHSDPGSQYRSRYFHKRLWRHRISQRMNRRGNCYDNSPMVRVFRRLKNEWIPPVVICRFSRFNGIRPHQLNGGLAPAQAQRKLKVVSGIS